MFHAPLFLFQTTGMPRVLVGVWGANLLMARHFWFF
jgi:hypothetical protein